ncbi:MAG: ferredoxin [bacterium]
MNELRASVNKNACIGCGLCAEICPSVFSMTPQGLAETTASIVDPSMGQAVREAAHSCPTNAISVF